MRRAELGALLRAAAMAAALVGTVPARAQLAPVDPDWREAQAPTPPALALDKLIPVDLPGSLLRFGVQSDSVSIGSDGIVRYVVVARSDGGAVNAMYEGLRCNTAQVRQYARHDAASGWKPVGGEPQWQALHGSAATRHSLVIARTGACLGHAANRSASQIVKDLRAPADTRFN